MALCESIGRRIAGALLAFGFALTGCVTPGTYDKVVNERDGLKKQVNDLEVRNRALQTRIAFVNQEILDEGAIIQAQQEVIKTQAEALTATLGVYGALVDVLAYETGNGTVSIVTRETVILVNVSAELLFPSGSADLDPAGAALAGKVAQAVASLPFQVVVGGYTDNKPIGGALKARYPTNWELGAARAARVVRALQSNGIAESRLVAVSFGETYPVASNDSPDGRAQNRRIELRLTPIVAGG